MKGKQFENRKTNEVIMIHQSKLIKRTELIGDEISQANEVSSEFPTNIRDYKKAQKGIKMVKKIIRKMRLKYGNRMTYLCLNF